MKYAKMLGLLAAAAAALMVFAGNALATEGSTGTDSAGGSPVEVGDTLHAESEGPTVLDGTVKLTCQNSTVDGHVENAGSATQTLSVQLTSVTFTECGNNTISVLRAGTLEIHTDTAGVDDGNGIATGTGTEVTVLTHNILGTVHCLYVTSNTNIGTVTGSAHQLSTELPQTATLDIGSTGIAQLTTDFACSNDSVWTGSYKITSPDYLYVH